MITFSLNTFIKISLLDTGGRIAEIQKRLVGKGGYDFYKPLQQAVRAHCDGDHSKALAILKRPSNDVERKHNKVAFDSFNAKLGSSRTLESINQSTSIQFKSAGIAIKLDPLFGCLKSGSQQAYALWPTKLPPLTQKIWCCRLPSDATCVCEFQPRKPQLHVRRFGSDKSLF